MEGGAVGEEMGRRETELDDSRDGEGLERFDEDFDRSSLTPLDFSFDCSISASLLIVNSFNALIDCCDPIEFDRTVLPTDAEGGTNEGECVEDEDDDNDDDGVDVDAAIAIE